MADIIGSYERLPNDAVRAVAVAKRREYSSSVVIEAMKTQLVTIVQMLICPPPPDISTCTDPLPSFFLSGKVLGSHLADAEGSFWEGKSIGEKIRFTGWWYTYPSEKIESQLILLFPICGKIKNVPNHQPVYNIDNTFKIF